MVIKEENIQFQLVSNSEFEERFTCVKQSLFIHVDSVFGWDDDFQRQRLLNDYHPSWFHWVYRGKERIGLVCFKPYDNAYHIHLLIISPQYQDQSLGKKSCHSSTKKPIKSNETKSLCRALEVTPAPFAFISHLAIRLLMTVMKILWGWLST